MADPDVIAAAEIAELTWGTSAFSAFDSPEERAEAWAKHRTTALMLYDHPGRRPLGWYLYERPDIRCSYDRERSTLWGTPGILSRDEVEALEAEWHHEFEHAYALGLNAAGRRAYYRWADLPRKLEARWRAERRRTGRAIRKLANAAQNPTSKPAASAT